MKQLFTISILTYMSIVVQAQSWLDKELYPFESKYQSLAAGKMHYIDEGEGEVILLVHGTPTWSFLYRDFVKTLSKNYRCIAIDHIGFGLSDKPEEFPGRPEDHANNLSEFIRKLDLKDITMIVHDFGGPIGLAAGIDNPERIKRLVLFNTWLWATNTDKDAQKIDKTINSWLGRFLYLRMNVSPKVLLKKGFSDKANLSKPVHRHYIQPFPDKESRHSLLNLAKGLVGSSDWYQSQWEQLDKLEEKACLIIWGTEDTFIKEPYLDKWRKRFPNAMLKALPCGHFVQEEQTEESIQMIMDFMRK